MRRIFILLIVLAASVPVLLAQNLVNITDASITAGQKVTWTKNNVYLCDGLVFVETGAELTIEAGTVVKFTPRADVGNPSALVIARGAKIFANGTKDNPIIFTAQADDVNNPKDLGPSDVSLWGGIVILGKGVTQKNGNAEVSVEGIPTGETRALYGGTDNNDDSGVMRYVSIRHGGRILSGSNELNGLTLGGVGSKTVLEYIEVYANSDDGIEFFGGAPNLKYAIVAFAEDDSYDWDEVYTGKGQFWFSIQRPDVADLGGEFDGTTPDDATPYSNGTVFNWTHIGTGTTATAGGIGLLLRAGTAGTIANSIFTESRGKAIEVQDKNAGVNDAYEKLKKGELKILNNLFWANGTTNAIDATASGVIRVTSGQPTQDEPNAATLVSHMVNNGNLVANPMLASVSRTANGKLDPRPSLSGAAYGPMAALPAGDNFFTSVNFKGAFSNDYSKLWIRKWSTLERNGHLGFIATSVQEFSNSLLSRFNIFPNPASETFTIEYDFEEAMRIEIFSVDGKLLRAIKTEGIGLNRIEMNGLNRGFYIVKFSAADGKFAAKKLIVE